MRCRFSVRVQGASAPKLGRAGTSLIITHSTCSPPVLMGVGGGAVHSAYSDATKPQVHNQGLSPGFLPFYLFVFTFSYKYRKRFTTVALVKTFSLANCKNERLSAQKQVFF